MKRTLYGIALILALTLGSGDAAAHTITVTPPQADSVVVNKDLAKGTKRMFDGRGNYVGLGPDSAASNGTNTACEAIPEGGVVDIDAGSTCNEPDL